MKDFQALRLDKQFKFEFKIFPGPGGKKKNLRETYINMGNRLPE